MNNNKGYRYDKFIIFLKHSYFKRSCLTPFKNKLINHLEESGVCIKPFFSSNFTRNISKCNFCQSKLRGMHRNSIMNDFTWDDNEIPEVNVLYIWLTEKKYYSDKIYPEQKSKLERDILLIVSGLLGASSVDCEVTLHKNDISIINGQLGSSTGVIEQEYKVKNEEVDDLKLNEEYDNTGAGLLIKSPEFSDFKKELDKKLKQIDKYTKKGFYVYYNNSPELLLFTYKRSRLKLKNYKYQIKQEKILEKSIQIRNVLYNARLCGQIKTSQSTIKIYTYIIKFFPLEELVQNYNNKFKINYDINKMKEDKFYRLRADYEEENVKMLIKNPEWVGNVQPIYNECLKYAEKHNCKDNLDEWIRTNIAGSFHSACHLFKNKKDVNKWFKANLNIEINIGIDSDSESETETEPEAETEPELEPGPRYSLFSYMYPINN